MIRDLEFPASYGPVQKIKVKGQLVYRTDWKRTNGRTDATDRVISPLTRWVASMAHLPEVRFDPVVPATANATQRFNFLRGKGVFNVFFKFPFERSEQLL